MEPEQLELLGHRPPSPILRLERVRARGTYLCAVCGGAIPRRTVYWRCDPSPWGRRFRGEKARHYCMRCVPDRNSHIRGRLTISAPAVVLIPQSDPSAAAEMEPVSVRLVSASEALLERLKVEPTSLHDVTPDQFEELICDRLYAMGMEPKRVGAVNEADGGIDVVFWPRKAGSFPFLGAAQVKHRGRSKRNVGVEVVRGFAGALLPHRFDVGLLVTNTSFTPNATWFAARQSTSLRLRDFDDVRRWLLDSFDSEEEWREIPKVLEILEGVRLKVR